MKLLLNMIVKNEAARIERALDSCCQFIDGAVICDTGSTDNTREIIKAYFNRHDLPVEIVNAPFVDWSQARNEALRAARMSRIGWDYALLMDADMELVVKDAIKFKDDGKWANALDMEQRSGSLRYLNRRIIHRANTGVYRGVTHEFLDIPATGCIDPEVAYFNDHADGANRPNKYERDIALLLKGLQDEPNNERYYYYLAQSYRDAGKPYDAAQWYRARVAAGGWDEEVWSAQVGLAHCLKDIKDEAGFIRELLVAYNMRPSRAESLYDLAHYFRHQEGKQATAALFAEAGMKIPVSKDALFVNDYVYRIGFKEEFAITGFYVPHRRWDAFKTCDELSQHSGPDGHVREMARHNLYHYMPKLETVCPSFQWKPIKFTPPEGWAALNPSITRHDDNYYCVVRTVNYKINEHGQYLIRGADESVNDHNPINTQNYLLDLGGDPWTDAVPHVQRIVAPADLPVEYPLVIGFEDMRLFSRGGQLWTSSTVRQLYRDGNCEQVIARLAQCLDPEPYQGLVDIKRMLREPRETEKNWAPVHDTGTFMWRPGTVVNIDGQQIAHNPPGFNVDNISGGSQLVPCAGWGYIALVHSARQIPGSPCRYYYHRFIQYTADFKVAHMSLPFVLHDKVIEFVSGMCFTPDGSELIISYGFKDCEARIAKVSLMEVLRFTWQLSK